MILNLSLNDFVLPKDKRIVVLCIYMYVIPCWINQIVCDVTATACNCGIIFMLLFVTRSISYLLQKDLNCKEDAVLKLQRYIRGHLARNLILGNLVASFRCLIFYVIV